MRNAPRILLTLWLVVLLVGAARQGVLAQGMTPAQLLSRAQRPWLPTYNPKTDWNFTHARPAAQRVCRRSETVPIPRADLPTAGQLPALATCNSAALYYGFAGKPDYVRARQCAYLERAIGDRYPMSGSAVLSMIYANGLGVHLNMPLATKFACEAGGAPAEINGRIGRLETLAKARRPPQPRFDFCDDVTSGYMTAVCAGVAEGMYEAQRKSRIERIAAQQTPAQKAAFLALQYVAQTYFNVHAGEEVNAAGTAGHAFQIDDLVHSEKAFMKDVDALNGNDVPASRPGATKRADARLAVIFRRVLANPALQPAAGNPLLPGVPMTEMGTITREGLRVSQALWLSYRDAWVHFAAVVRPGLARGAVSAWITRQRIEDLRCLLPFHDKDFRQCNVPVLSPADMAP